MDILLKPDRQGWYCLMPWKIEKITLRAVSIVKDKQRVSDPDSHEVDQAKIEGGIKFSPTRYNIEHWKKMVARNY